MELLEVITQAVFVEKQNGHMVKLVAQPVTVTAAEWPTYATTGFVAAVAAAEQEMARQRAAVTPNRATRRAAPKKRPVPAAGTGT